MPPRSFLRNLFWTPKFRSRREKVGHFIYGFVIFVPVICLAAYFEWLNRRSLHLLLWVLLGGLVLHSAGWLVWEFWGRKRFPLPAPDESKSTA